LWPPPTTITSYFVPLFEPLETGIIDPELTQANQEKLAEYDSPFYRESPMLSLLM
jgi:hypothetical protein